MAKTFYGYAEREADSFVDWSQIGKDITTMLQTEVQLREDKKQALSDATKAYEEQLANAPQGEYTDANEYISNFSNDATQAMLMQERLLKSGQLKVKDYVLARDNLVSGTNQMFKIAEEYQTAYSDGLKRWKDGESSYREFWQLRQAEGLANFKNTRAMINPTNFKVSVAKMMKNDEGVYEMSQDPNDFMTVNELRNRLQGKFDKFDLLGETQAAVGTLGEMEEVIVSAAKAEGGINTIIKNSDAKKGNYYLPGEEETIRGYKQWEDNTIKSFMSNPNNTMSLLTDFNIRSKNGQQIEPTYNYEQFKNDTTGKYVYLDTSSGSKEGIPVFKPDQQKQVEESLRTNIRAQIDVKASASTSTKPFKSAERVKTDAGFQQNKEDARNYLTDWIQLSKAGVTKELARAASDNITGRNIKDEKGNKLIRIEKDENGLKLIYRPVNKDGYFTGKPFEQDVSFADPETYIRAVRQIMPKGVRDALSNEELIEEGKKGWGSAYDSSNPFNTIRNSGGMSLIFDIPSLSTLVPEDGELVPKKIEDIYNEQNTGSFFGGGDNSERAAKLASTTSLLISEYNSNFPGEDRITIKSSTDGSTMNISDNFNNSYSIKYADQAGMASVKKLLDYIPLEINKGSYGEEEIDRERVAKSLYIALQQYGELVDPDDKNIGAEGTLYSMNELSDIKGNAFNALLDQIIGLGTGSGIDLVQEETEGEVVQKPKLPGQQ